MRVALTPEQMRCLSMAPMHCPCGLPGSWVCYGAEFATRRCREHAEEMKRAGWSITPTDSETEPSATP